MSNSEAVDHFRQGREALLRKRREIDRSIADVDRIIAQLAAGDQLTFPSTPAPENGARPTIKETILQILSDGRAWRVPEILTELSARNVPSHDQSVRSILAKMKDAKVISNPSRGFYQSKDGAATEN